MDILEAYFIFHRFWLLWKY